MQERHDTTSDVEILSIERLEESIADVLANDRVQEITINRDKKSVDIIKK